MNPASVQAFKLTAAPVGGSDVISDRPALAQARECDDPGRSKAKHRAAQLLQEVGGGPGRAIRTHLQGGPAVIGDHQRLTAGFHLAE